MRNIIGLAFVCLALTACNNGKKKSEMREEPGELRRYEVSLFSIDTNKFEEGLRKIYPSYKVFLGETFPSDEGVTQLLNFVTDPYIRSTYNYTMKKYPDLEFLKTGLDKGFLNFKKEMPEKRIPQVYTYISGFDIRMPIKYTDSALIIGLDLYLGSDYEEYRELGYPLYITERLSREYILADCFREIGWAYMPTIETNTLLDAMIEQGKLLYFAEKMLPGEKEEYLIKYSPEELEWIKNNEKNLWSFLIENQLLYSNDAKAMTTFMTDGPFTSGFSEESPSRTGHWLGWQIVKNYMQKNDLSIEALLGEKDSQKILQESGYKPAR